MSLISTIETKGAHALSSVEHAAAWLVGVLATADTSLHVLEEQSPLVAEAIVIGEAAATSHGVPVAQVVNVGAAVLQAAHALVDGLKQRPV